MSGRNGRVHERRCGAANTVFLQGYQCIHVKPTRTFCKRRNTGAAPTRISTSKLDEIDIRRILSGQHSSTDRTAYLYITTPATCLTSQGRMEMTMYAAFAET